MNSILSVNRISKRFGRTQAIADITFELQPETITVLLGSNGAGKSTLLRCILGLCKPEEGAIRVLGRDPLRDSSSVRASIGFMPDHPDVYGWMTARDLFDFLRDQYPGWSEEREQDLADRLQIPLDSRFDTLSRGEAAKVMLAAALAPAPPLLALDEPFARLAPPVCDEVLKVFLEEAPAPHGAVLVATHDLELAARIADRVLVMDQGRLIADRAIEDLCDGTSTHASLHDRLRELYRCGRKHNRSVEMKAVAL
jgi:ABC-2 type transport system ATP-binding protein